MDGRRMVAECDLRCSLSASGRGRPVTSFTAVPPSVRWSGFTAVIRATELYRWASVSKASAAKVGARCSAGLLPAGRLSLFLRVYSFLLGSVQSLHGGSRNELRRRSAGPCPSFRSRIRSMTKLPLTSAVGNAGTSACTNHFLLLRRTAPHRSTFSSAASNASCRL